MEAEIGMRLPQAKKHQESPEARRGRERVLPWRLRREYGPADTLISDVRPPELCENKFPLLGATEVVALVPAALGNTYGQQLCLPLMAVMSRPPTCPGLFSLAHSRTSMKACEVLILKGLVSVFGWVDYPKGGPKPKNGYQNTTAIQVTWHERHQYPLPARGGRAALPLGSHLVISHSTHSTEYPFARPILEKRKPRLRGMR